MRRSLLFMPGNNPAMLQNSDVFDADTVIYDLEDAVSVSEKDSARILVSEFIRARGNTLDMEVAVRINGLDTELYMADLDAIVIDGVDTVMLPKATAKALYELDRILTELEEKRGIKTKLSVIPIIELTSSLLEVKEIAGAPRVSGILLGAEDLTSDLDVPRTKSGEEILYARMCISYTCSAYKIDAIDTPYTDTADNEGLLSDCKFAMGLGFTSKSAIHPNQIPVINTTFVPSRERIEWALRVREATKRAMEKGLGVFSLDGKMVDNPVIDRAEKILKKAERYNLI